MKAFVYDKRSAAEKLVLREIPRPVPRKGEVLVKVKAVSVNAADYRSLQGGIIPKTRIFGADISGIVTETGEGAGLFKEGDEVLGDIASHGFGGMAEFAAVPEKLLVLKPPRLSFAEAAAFPMASLTALQALRDKARIRRGEGILILGAGGGVGTFAVQLAGYFGAVITAVCGSANAANVKSLGADRVLDYSREDVLNGQELFDVILAVNGNYPLLKCRSRLRPGGRYVMIGGAMPQVLKALVFGKMLSTGSRKIRFLMGQADRKDLQYLMDLWVQGAVRPVMDREYGFARSIEAVTYLAQGHSKGKVVITIG